MTGSRGSQPDGDKDKDVWHVYIVQCADNTLYTGVAREPAKRVHQHNAGRGARYTRGRLPVELVYEEQAGDRGSALKREYEIKRLNAREKRKLIGGGRPWPSGGKSDATLGG